MPWLFAQQLHQNSLHSTHRTRFTLNAVRSYVLGWYLGYHTVDPVGHVPMAHLVHAVWLALAEYVPTGQGSGDGAVVAFGEAGQ